MGALAGFVGAEVLRAYVDEMLMSLSLHFVGGLMAVDVDVEIKTFLASHSLLSGTSLPYLTTLKVCELAKQAGY
ncbi:hypothetical protein SCA6_020477 [Theobroma cacao]